MKPIRTRNQPMQPIPEFAFVNRREIDFALAALNRLAASGDVDPMEADDFTDFLDAFQAFALSV